jgi:toxin ParE1/3/4
VPHGPPIDLRRRAKSITGSRLRLVLSARARRDLSGIRAYGRAQWGEQQANEYSAALSRAFQVLRDYPLLGVARDDLAPGLRSFSVEQHRIIYRVKGDVIRVLRVVHSRQDESQQLNR